MLDVVEAVFAEGVGIDTHLNDLDEQIARAYPDRDRWGMTPQQQAATAAAERLFGTPTTSDEDAPRTVAPDAADTPG